MINLRPFNGEELPFKVQFLLDRQGSSIQFEFQVTDPNGLISWPENKQSRQRMNELWKETCFEIFLSEKNNDDYFEVNLTHQGNWNIYHFDNYRSPQPPEETNQIELSSLVWDGHCLSGQLKTKIDLRELDFSATAVIKTKKNETVYLAAHHAGAKPDFHLRNSFIIKG